MLRSSPLVSVVIPTYNRSSVIGHTIEDVLKQTYSNLEIIIVDDGSTDDTEAVLQRFGNSIRYVKQENAGPAAARNRGIEIARGEIIAFQDSDDLWHPSKIERQVRLLEDAGPAVPCCLCNTTLCFADGRVTTSFRNAPIDPLIEEGIWTNPAAVLTTRFILFDQAVAIRAAVLRKTGGFDTTLKYLEDYELPLRLALEGPWAFIRTPLATWRQGSVHSWSQKASEEALLTQECQVALRQRILQRLNDRDGDAELQVLMRRHLSRAQRQFRDLRMIHSSSRMMRSAGRLFFQLERYRAALGRRLPGYPRMSVRPVPAAATLPLQECSPGERLVPAQPGAASSNQALRMDK